MRKARLLYWNTRSAVYSVKAVEACTGMVGCTAVFRYGTVLLPQGFCETFLPTVCSVYESAGT